MPMRVGIGIDAHRFGDGERLVLGGVEFDHPVGLEGHSDADVVLHALMDAMLGACGAGDIGEMFPDTDEAHRDASSLELLAKVSQRTRTLGFRLINADIAVMCEEPKIGPFKATMAENIARRLGVNPRLISVKGTTTEGMGFTGRGEGILSIASVLMDEI
jgi:2-C-methyl-D-erythritol 2,4-cyclodiphosphate synthase